MSFRQPVLTTDVPGSPKDKKLYAAMFAIRSGEVYLVESIDTEAIQDPLAYISQKKLSPSFKVSSAVNGTITVVPIVPTTYVRLPNKIVDMLNVYSKRCGYEQMQHFLSSEQLTALAVSDLMETGTVREMTLEQAKSEAQHAIHSAMSTKALERLKFLGIDVVSKKRLPAAASLRLKDGFEVEPQKDEDQNDDTDPVEIDATEV